MFWCVFDGLLSYITPIVLTEAGFSETMMGIIIGTSSIAGAVFDFFLCRVFKKASFKRIFLIMFIVCAIYPLILWQAKSFWVFIIAMALWGIYYDLFNFGSLDYLGNNTNKQEHASSSGVLQVFRSLGYLLAPIFAGFVIGEAVGWESFALSWVFLLIAAVFYIGLVRMTKEKKRETECQELVCDNLQIKKEIRLWKKTTSLLKPVLILSVLISTYDAFFWTIGPLFAESFKGMENFQGLFLTAYELPALIVGWFIGKATVKLGKKRTAFAAFGIGSVILAILPLISSPFIAIVTIFFASLFLSMAAPAINGTYADYVEEAPKAEKEIEAVSDFSFNIGYIVGPIAAGVLADNFSNSIAFSILSVFGFIIVIILFKITPRKINVSPLDKMVKQ
ncbi:MAG: MFS transporter [Candidatus Saccharimonadaceae bacterium]|nr:MFS transporter [Candidatus Saccharimonadaceae bacterium]